MTPPASSSLAAASPANTSPTDATPSGLAPRLHPYDGLFLRATHLETIQDHAASRQLRTAQAGGSGVVEGLAVALDGDHVHVGAGFAVDPSGRILEVPTSLLADLPSHDDSRIRSPGADLQTVWEIVLVGTCWYEGTDEVFGDLCHDPCQSAGSAVGRPYIRDGVRIELRPHDLTMVSRPGYSGPAYRHNRIVSEWFRREQATAESWIPSGLLGSEWSEAPAVAVGDGVPLGLAWYAGGNWHLDQWAARRERIEPGNLSGLQHRLGMRPLSVFMAQLNQFQDQLARSWNDDVAPDVSQMGFVELPPAGYLPWVAPQDDSSQGIPDHKWAAMVGLRTATSDSDEARSSRLSLCRCPPDYVPRAVLEAQHLQRMDVFDDEVVVEILRPLRFGPNGKWSSVPWIAFRRHADCYDPNDLEERQR